MKSAKENSIFVIGFALFSMFFGSGNLIFPLYVGQIAQDQSIFATLGFLITSVLLPFLGVIAMLVYKGDYTDFFSSLGKRAGFFVSALLLTTWIPLGSAPRCITLAYASFLPYISLPSTWIFSFIYCFVVYKVVSKENCVLDILGRFLTPLLLSCLACVIFKGLLGAPSIKPSVYQVDNIFFKALCEGYNTMDLIASFFFSASIIGMLKREGQSELVSLSKVYKSGLIGMGLLMLVYVGLIFLSSGYSQDLSGVAKDQLLAHISRHVLGARLGVVASFAIALACFTTSVALVVVYVDFLMQNLFTHSKRGKSFGILFTLAMTYGMSLMGLGGITALTAPILELFYPLLIFMILSNVTRKFMREGKEKIWSFSGGQSRALLDEG